MKLKVEEEIKTKLQLEAENGKVHYVNSNNKLKKRKTHETPPWQTLQIIFKKVKKTVNIFIYTICLPS